MGQPCELPEFQVRGRADVRGRGGHRDLPCDVHQQAGGREEDGGVAPGGSEQDQVVPASADIGDSTSGSAAHPEGCPRYDHSCDFPIPFVNTKTGSTHLQCKKRHPAISHRFLLQSKRSMSLGRCNQTNLIVDIPQQR